MSSTDPMLLEDEIPKDDFFDADEAEEDVPDDPHQRYRKQ